MKQLYLLLYYLGVLFQNPPTAVNASKKQIDFNKSGESIKKM